MDPQFIRLANIGEFKSRKIKSFQILGKFVAIVKNTDGSFYATEIACKHNNADLTTGQFRGDFVTCPRHGWVYNIRTGECLNQRSTPLRRHALRIEGEDIYVCTIADEPIDEDDPFPTIEFRRKED